MKVETKNIFMTIVILFCLLPAWASARVYTVSTSTSSVDGDTFCGGKCDSDDTIIIQGGARGDLEFKDFDGNGSYITITNENANPDSRVVITGNDNGPSWAPLGFKNCSYIDVRGDNDPGLEYGIKVYLPASYPRTKTVWVYQEGDHIKLSYLEIAGEDVGSCIGVLDESMINTSIFDTFEIHHNYLHDNAYAGMYLGHNEPWNNNDPYIKDVSVHDNLLEDMGAYGITLKGVHSSSGPCSIYNNTVRGSSGGQSTGLVRTDLHDMYKHGIGVQYFVSPAYANVYNNWIEKTVGPGLKIGDLDHNIYDNKILGCGTGSLGAWDNAIFTYQSTSGIDIYDNIIIQPPRYGVYASGDTATGGVTLSRNLIGDAGLGEWYAADSGDIIESTGDDANWYEADVADFGFTAWSDDNDYSNDDFTRTTSELASPTGLRVTDVNP